MKFLMMLSLFSVVKSNFSANKTALNLLSTSNVTGILALDLVNNIGEIIGNCSVSGNCANTVIKTPK